MAQRLLYIELVLKDNSCPSNEPGELLDVPKIRDYYRPV